MTRNTLTAMSVRAAPTGSLQDTICFLFPRLLGVHTMFARTLSILFVAALVLASSAMANTVIYQGLSHTSLGSAVLVPSGSDLIVNNIGSSGLDGVAVDINPAGLYQMDWLPLDPTDVTPDVELLKLSARGGVGGGLVQSLGQSTLTRMTAGTEFEINADFSAVGSATWQLQLFLGGALVFSQSGLSGSGPVVNSVDGTDLPQTVKMAIPTFFSSSNPGFVWDFGSSHTVTVPGGPTILSDEVRMLADSASGPFNFLSEFSVLARDMPQNQIVITGSVSQPIPEPASLALMGLGGLSMIRRHRIHD